MTIDGDIIELEFDMDISEVKEFETFISSRLEYIDAIKLVGDKSTFTSSALFALLWSIKKTKPSIIIKEMDEDLRFENYGLIHWEKYD